MRAIRVLSKSVDIDRLDLSLVEQPRPVAQAGQVVVEVRSAGVNPSDAKAALGLMPHAVWPRIPGRDYAGVVVDGPAGWLNRRVWGSGGDLGIRRDGTHATHLVVDLPSVREFPEALDMREAGTVGVPFVTAYEGLRRAGLPGRGDVVLVMGANGAVGQAAMQIAGHLGVEVIGVVRSADAWRGHCAVAPTIVDASVEDVAERVRELTRGRGADIVYNTVGSPYFEAANRAMALGARQIFISTPERAVAFDIFAFYRGQHTYVGVDSLALDSTACARVFDVLAPAFATGSLRPFAVADESAFDLEQAAEAYRSVLGGTRQRIVIEP